MPNVEFLHTKCLHNRMNGKYWLDNVYIEVSNAKPYLKVLLYETTIIILDLKEISNIE